MSVIFRPSGGTLFKPGLILFRTSVQFEGACVVLFRIQWISSGIRFCVSFSSSICTPHVTLYIHAFFFFRHSCVQSIVELKHILKRILHSNHQRSGWSRINVNEVRIRWLPLKPMKVWLQIQYSDQKCEVVKVQINSEPVKVLIWGPRCPYLYFFWCGSNLWNSVLIIHNAVGRSGKPSLQPWKTLCSYIYRLQSKTQFTVWEIRWWISEAVIVI